MADILAVLYGSVLRVDSLQPDWPDRDRLGGEQWACGGHPLCRPAESGFVPIAELDTYSANGGRLAGHVTRTGCPGVELSTGSLGHGLPVSGRHGAPPPSERSASWRAFCILSDGELDEGSDWEDVQMAQHFALSNRVAIVDYNKIQSFGSVSEVIDLRPLADKFRAFNWGVHELDGHDHAALTIALNGPPALAGHPTVVIAHTIKGKGVSFMEGQLAWHYKSPDGGQLEAALSEVEANR